MKRVAKNPYVLAVLGAALLGACSTSNYTSPVQVTRFIADQPAALGNGTIAVVPAPGGEGDSLIFAAYQSAVAAQLTQLGYSIVPAEQAEQVAELRLESFVEQPERRRGPVNVGVGGSTGSYGSGLGIGLGIDLSGPPPELLSSEMGVIIRNVSDQAPLWEGRAGFSTRADGDLADPAANAAKLADALFAGFPGESGETISVK